MIAPASHLHTYTHTHTHTLPYMHALLTADTDSNSFPSYFAFTLYPLPFVFFSLKTTVYVSSGFMGAMEGLLGFPGVFGADGVCQVAPT